jgi:hypothetical protein
LGARVLAASSLVRKVADERQVYVAERSISQAKPERRLSAAADIRPPNLSGSTQSIAGTAVAQWNGGDVADTRPW